jgi:hypothetical protein
MLPCYTVHTFGSVSSFGTSNATDMYMRNATGGSPGSEVANPPNIAGVLLKLGHILCPHCQPYPQTTAESQNSPSNTLCHVYISNSLIV